MLPFMHKSNHASSISPHTYKHTYMYVNSILKRMLTSPIPVEAPVMSITFLASSSGYTNLKQSLMRLKNQRVGTKNTKKMIEKTGKTTFKISWITSISRTKQWCVRSLCVANTRTKNEYINWDEISDNQFYQLAINVMPMIYAESWMCD